MKYLFFILTVLGCLLITAPATNAQDLQGTLQQLSQDAAKSYVAPIVSGLGADLNGGWFHKAPRAVNLGFDFEIGVVAMGTFFKNENKVFSNTGSFQFDSLQAYDLANNAQYNGTSLPPPLIDSAARAVSNQKFQVTISGPTAVGNKSDRILVTFPGQTIFAGGDSIVIPTRVESLMVGGLFSPALTALPLAAPQLTIGTVFGTQFSFRYLPNVQITQQIGSFKYFGFGIQHNPAVWLGTPLPLDLSVGYFTQTMDVGTLISTTTKSWGIQASKQLGWSYLNLTPYFGYLHESSTMTFTYTPAAMTLPDGEIYQPDPVNFALTGQNTSRITAGLGIRLGIINVNADYNFATYNSATAGVMLSF